MNVYSIVPSQRSQATVSVRISKMIPRYDQITAPISRIVVWRSTSSVPPRGLDAVGDEHDRERVGDRPDEERELPPAVALDQVGVALDHAERARSPAAGRRARGAHHAASSSSLVLERRGRSRPGTRPRACPRRSGARSAAGGSSASSRPRSRIPTRSASASASAMSCVHSSVVVSCSRRTSRMKRLHLELGARVEPGRRLVEQQQRRRRSAARARAPPSAACRARGPPSAPTRGRPGSRRARGSPASARASRAGPSP